MPSTLRILLAVAAAWPLAGQPSAEAGERSGLPWARLEIK